MPYGCRAFCACVQDAKRTRRKRRELKRKAKIRLAEAAATSGIGEEQHECEEALFSLGTIKGAKALHATGVPHMHVTVFPVVPRLHL